MGGAPPSSAAAEYHRDVEHLLRLEGVVRHYAWGSRDAIPRLLGRPHPAEAPWAELWMGAHPAAPSRVGDAAGGAAPLDQRIAEAPAELLGRRVLSAFGPRLPFLFKILAAARPLSIQCHPDEATARAGFAREEQGGPPRDAPERTYRDPHHKPELLVALSRFEALAGFQPVTQVGDRARAILRAAGADPPDGDDLAALFAALMAIDPAQAPAAQAAARAALGGAGPAAAWLDRLCRDFPADAARLAPLYLNHLELDEGDGLYLPAGLLHSYLGGTGLEIMASSDNVLRGGLTEKHIDRDELMRVVNFAPGPPPVLRPALDDGGLWRYAAPAREFALSYADLGREAGPLRWRRRPDPGPAIVLVLGGGARLAEAQAPGGEVSLEPGGAAFVSGAAGALELSGDGRIWLAEVP